MTKRTVVYVGPRVEARGGIASVIESYVSSPLSRHYNIKVYGTANGDKSIFAKTASIKGVIACITYLWTHQRALVHLHTASRGSFYRKSLIALAARMRRDPVVMHVHGGQFHKFCLGGSWLRRWWIRRTLEASDAVIVLSQVWIDRIGAFVKKGPVLIVPNPVTLPLGWDDSSPLAGEPHILFVGRLESTKGVYDLLEAVEELQVRGIEVRLTLAGDGEIATVRSHISSLPRPELVACPGWVTSSALSVLLQQTNIFCLPSYDEGVPMALLNAMAHQLACVVTPVGGIPDLIVSGKNGILVPIRDSRALAESLCSVVLDPARRQRLGYQARLSVSKNAIAEVVADLERIYSDLGFAPCLETNDGCRSE